MEYERVFTELCVSMNNILKKNVYVDTKLSGSTGVMVLCQKGKLVCANVGDSGAILYLNEPQTGLRTVRLSQDHKPSDPIERQRILGVGGKVHPCRRTLG